MASSSSYGRIIGGWTYDVFLSFRGEDTRNNFVDHLHTALVRNGIRVFKDDVMLHKGNQISSDLLTAIQESRFAVVVFSKSYANSSWCLDELTKIKDCQDSRGQTVLPIFYHVDPSDVRGQKRDFATAFQQHEEKFSQEMDKVNKWREALATAGNLSGWHISPNNGGESVFINEIVQKISGDIKPCGMENNLIDIEPRTNRLKSLLCMEATNEVRMLGIYGMGGMGKTTIARALFRRISNTFDGCSFVNDVREKGSSNRDICALQQKILKDMVHHDESNVIDPEVGAGTIQKRCGNKKVLLVLDDVDNFKQLEFLAARHDWFGVGSRIIITTRNESLLSDTDDKYKPAILLKDHAVQLFSRHAFREISPPEGYEELSDRVIHYSHGLPLALKVLGSFFRKKDAGVWESALNRLAKTPNKEIFDILKFSFDSLEDSEQKIFLDIACFFKGQDKEHVTRVLDSFDFDAAIGICTLIEKSLITISRGCIYMHDVLQEMGFEIVRKSYPNSRLRKHKEINDVITKNRELEAIEGICHYYWDEDEVEDKGFGGDVFEKMKNLRLLKTYGAFTSREPTFLPNELQWLKWNHYPFCYLPVASLRKLGGLELSHGSIQHLWKGYKSMPNLKFIHLKDLSSLETFPDVSGAPNVERLTLRECRNLVMLHQSLGTLRKLVYLKVSDCGSLQCLPSLIEMPLLETLDLSDCSSLEDFPEVSSGNEKLSVINLNGCSCIKVIPSSVCELKDLKSLHLHNCNDLQILPTELGNMGKLEVMQLGSLFGVLCSINSHDLTKLCCLRKLDLRGRRFGEEDFPSNFHEFSSLEELDLSRNLALIQLPASISHLSSLKHLKLNGCKQLQSIHGLPSSIQVLEAGYCVELQRIEDLTEKYLQLYKMWLPGCKRLLENQETARYLDKMLQQSLLKKCAATGHVFSIVVPGSKIPCWFEEKQDGDITSLKLPPKCDMDIMGFAVCGVMKRPWHYHIDISIHFKVGHNRISILESEVEVEVDNIDTSVEAMEESNMWIAYIPFSLFQEQMYDEFGGEDWSRFLEGNLMITMAQPWEDRSLISKKFVRCGAHLVYKDDVKWIQQQINTSSVTQYRPKSSFERNFDGWSEAGIVTSDPKPVPVRDGHIWPSLCR
ncbi:hypothetical protein OSB04_028934 [Centaurea solstitialis]|uniref:ADP-ribosyl cyclase/cyclic ADP-ribose hydrolase n=1 Tax=Centaurea solstitialis TaxID=347529 RepID=A0AA38SHI2_9ASTR|nr:hypothetical protein OSB04_028934 [Centaurea solstitialis]